jgi:hypothetical protein
MAVKIANPAEAMPKALKTMRPDLSVFPAAWGKRAGFNL